MILMSRIIVCLSCLIILTGSFRVMAEEVDATIVIVDSRMTCASQEPSRINSVCSKNRQANIVKLLIKAYEQKQNNGKFYVFLMGMAENTNGFTHNDGAIAEPDDLIAYWTSSGVKQCLASDFCEEGYFDFKDKLGAKEKQNIPVGFVFKQIKMSENHIDLLKSELKIFEVDDKHDVASYIKKQLSSERNQKIKTLPKVLSAIDECENDYLDPDLSTGSGVIMSLSELCTGKGIKMSLLTKNTLSNFVSRLRSSKVKINSFELMVVGSMSLDYLGWDYRRGSNSILEKAEANRVTAKEHRADVFKRYFLKSDKNNGLFSKYVRPKVPVLFDEQEDKFIDPHLYDTDRSLKVSLFSTVEQIYPRSQMKLAKWRFQKLPKFNEQQFLLTKKTVNDSLVFQLKEHYPMYEAGVIEIPKLDVAVQCELQSSNQLVNCQLDSQEVRVRASEKGIVDINEQFDAVYKTKLKAEYENIEGSEVNISQQITLIGFDSIEIKNPKEKVFSVYLPESLADNAFQNKRKQKRQLILKPLEGEDDQLLIDCQNKTSQLMEGCIIPKHLAPNEYQIVDNLTGHRVLTVKKNVLLWYKYPSSESIHRSGNPLIFNGEVGNLSAPLFIGKSPVICSGEDDATDSIKGGRFSQAEDGSYSIRASNCDKKEDLARLVIQMDKDAIKLKQKEINKNRWFALVLVLIAAFGVFWWLRRSNEQKFQSDLKLINEEKPRIIIKRSEEK